MRLGLFLMMLSLGLVSCGDSDDAGHPAAGAGKPDAPAAAAVPKAGENPALRDPIKAAKKAPDFFEVEFDTTQGQFTVAVERKDAPHGADRFYSMVCVGYYTDVRFFRVGANFMAQFGIHGDPTVNEAWARSPLPADRVTRPNTKGWLTFAMGRSPDSRSNQMFINTKDNRYLDKDGFAPVGKVTVGMDVVLKLYSGYGEGPGGPDQAKLKSLGNAYLDKDFPKLDAIKSAKIIER